MFEQVVCETMAMVAASFFLAELRLCHLVTLLLEVVPTVKGQKVYLTYR